MDPLSAAMSGIGGLASIYSANQTANSNDYIANLNYQLEQAKEADTIAAAKNQDAFRDQQYADTQAGYTDAAGNRVHFVQGQGWVTDETPEQQKLDAQQRSVQELQNTEQEKKLTIDAARQREQSGQIMQSNDRANQMANSYAQLMSTRTPTDTNDSGNIGGLESVLQGQAGGDAAIKAAAVGAARGAAGSSNYGQLVSAATKDANNDWFSKFLTGQQAGREAGMKENASNNADELNDFNTAAGQAKTPIGGSQVAPVQTNIYGDTQLSNAGTAGQAQMSTEGQALGSGLESAYEKTPTPQMDYQSQNNALGNFFASMAGQTKGLSSMFNIPQSQKYTYGTDRPYEV